MGHHDQILREVVETLRGLTTTMLLIVNQLNPVPTHHSPSTSGPSAPSPSSGESVYLTSEPNVLGPEHDDGDLGACRSVLL